MSIPMSETDSLGSEVVDRKSSLYLKNKRDYFVCRFFGLPVNFCSVVSFSTKQIITSK